MARKQKTLPDLEFHPLTIDRWSDFEDLLGDRGGCKGCWCMWWRLYRNDFERLRGEGNRLIMKTIVESGEVPGIIAYAKNIPIAWCSVAPREHFQRLQRSHMLGRVDDKPVWSIVCFYVDWRFRKQGVTVKLLQAVIEYVEQQGGEIIEGYPVDSEKKRIPAVDAITGFASAFKKAGFVECLRQLKKRPIMRYYIKK